MPVNDVRINTDFSNATSERRDRSDSWGDSRVSQSSQRRFRGFIELSRGLLLINVELACLRALSL